ncbi:MAG: type II secretion system protein GspJ [Candidatus Omnitrophica bacterium]|nr:type II secretion system protein GspJ [Candidatus Omnitrophota bacterium]MDD5652817.1 type II secretion system protein GspJ [Candidatus Omnitrophota bacterium]
MIKKKGFTLIEVLLAVSLSAVIVVGVYSALQTGILSYEKQESAAGIYQTAKVILNRMESDLKNSYCYMQSGSGFKGGKAQSGLEFFSVSEVFEKGESRILPCRVRYELTDKVLKRYFYRGLEASETNSLLEPQELAADIKDISLEFAYRSSDANNPIAWQDTWPAEQNQDQEKSLPLAVRIKLTLIEKDRHGEEVSAVDFLRTIAIPLGGNP